MIATKYAYIYSCFTSNEYLTSVDHLQQFVIVVQKFVCTIFCRVISQQHDGFSDLRYKVFVIAKLHFINLCVSENES